MRRKDEVGAKACFTPRLSYNAGYISGMTVSFLTSTLSQGAEMTNYPLLGQPFKFACFVSPQIVSCRHVESAQWSEMLIQGTERPDSIFLR